MNWAAVGVVGGLVSLAASFMYFGMRLSFFAGQLVQDVRECKGKVESLETRFNSLSPAPSAIVGAQQFAGLNHG